MSNIGQFLEQIMHARYGKDVRQSIHDAIEEVDRVADTAQDSATAAAAAAAESVASIAGVEERVKESENNVAASAAAAAESEANALASEVSTATSERNVAEMQAKAKASEQASAESEANAAASEQASKASEQASAESEANAAASEQASKASEQAAAESETNALNYRDYAKSYALGTNGVVRPGDEIDNALYFYEQVKRISQGLQGALMPMGTITFAQLPTVTAQAGYMYNISDGFTTDDTFNEGAGHECPAGTNVYLTADGKWDCMAGTAVGGVKGAKEATYRQGLVNLTPENIGALPEDGDSAENTVTFETADAAEANVWTDVDVLASGEKHKSIFRKVSMMFKNVRYLNASKLNAADLLDKIYPVGCIYMSVKNVSPASFIGGTWVTWGAGKVPVGVDTSDANFNVVEKTGGEKRHTLTVGEMPSHTHAVTEWLFNGFAASGTHYGKAYMEDDGRVFTGGSNVASISATGGSTAHNNLQPYITCYMWVRTA